MGPSHDHHDHERSSPSRIVDRIRRALSHSHEHDELSLADSGAAGVRAAKVSLAGLGVTALLQAVVVAFTGSVALLSDTLHNLTDALTAIPLWIAFSVGRRPTSRRFTFGLGRAEDLAGLVILVAIAASAGGVAWESIRRLFEPRELDHIPWVIAAGIVGAIGNEAVARYRMRVGRSISSEALVADGQHARADALTSLAVVAAGVGAEFGATWMDPIAGLVVAGMILLMLRHAARRVLGRFLDAIDPEMVDTAEKVARGVDGVEAVEGIRMRWHGHHLIVTMVIAVDPHLTVRQGHDIAQNVSHVVMHAFPIAVEALVHVDPMGDDDAHTTTEHHR